MKQNAIVGELGEGGFAQVLESRSFRSLWFGQIASQLAFSMLLFVLALRVYQVTGSNAIVSGLFLTFGVPAVIFGMVAGAIVEQLDKRAVLLLCDIARAFLALGFLFFGNTLWYIYTLAFFLAVLTQFYVPSEAPTIPRFVPPGALVSANSLFSFTYYSSLAIGSIVAGPMLRWFGPYGIFVFISGLFAFAAWQVWHLPKEAGSRGVRQILQFTTLPTIIAKVFRNLREGIWYVIKTKALADALLLLTGTQIILAMLGALGPGFADRVLQIDIHDASLIIIGPVVLGILVGALWIGSRGSRLPSSFLIQRGIAGAGVILILISLTVRLQRFGGIPWFSGWVLIIVELGLFFLLGVANSMLDVPSNSVLQAEARGELRSRVYGILTAAVGGVGILPVVLGGILADRIGVGKVILWLGIMISAYGLYRVRCNK